MFHRCMALELLMIGPCKLDGSPLLRSREWRLQFWNASIMDTWDLGPQLRGSPALPSKLKMTHVCSGDPAGS